MQRGARTKVQPQPGLIRIDDSAEHARNDAPAGAALRISAITLPLREVAGLPDPDVRPPTVAEAGDPFGALRVAHLVARMPRGAPVRLRDIVDRLNAEYLDWSFSRSVVAAVAVQLQANWNADFRSQHGFELSDGPAGDELTIEDSSRVEPWLIRQVARYADECGQRLLAFARDEGGVP